MTIHKRHDTLWVSNGRQKSLPRTFFTTHLPQLTLIPNNYTLFGLENKHVCKINNTARFPRSFRAVFLLNEIYKNVNGRI